MRGQYDKGQKKKIESEMVEEVESINIKMSKTSMDVGYTEMKNIPITFLYFKKL